MKKTDFLAWSVPISRLGISEKFQTVTLLVVESLAGKRRIFVPGRSSNPLEVRKFNQKMVKYALQALISCGWEFQSQQIIGISILTEGAGVPFFEAFAEVWPDGEAGGILNVWARRQLEPRWVHRLLSFLPFLRGWLKESETYAQYRAKVRGADVTFGERPIPGAVGIFFDIGATGATLEKVIPAVVPFFTRLIFASPCTSGEAAGKFVEKAVASGIEPINLAIVASEGFFGLHQNGTFLSLQLPGTITSCGNEALSRVVYPHPEFCHIGAGGLAANWPFAYQAELKEDERRFGRLYRFESLEELMNHAGGLRWPDDFGGPI